jgi:poly(3-hydroxybutyrate) depolymerase
MLEPASGMLDIEVEGQMGQYLVSIPPGYDPETPYPLGFAFHGRNRTGPNCHDGDCAGFQEVMEDDAVLVYMTALGGMLGWEGDGERELNVAFFEAVLAEISATTCIDESRIFAAGTSSGAHFTNILGCRFGDILLAIAPVAGYLPETECVDSVAALVIHGIDDYHVPFDNGEEARDFWRTRNGCSDQTEPPISDVHAMVVATDESHACATYQGCDPGLPVVWCEHSEGGYDGSTHGWPLFGGQQIWDFVQSI